MAESNKGIAEFLLALSDIETQTKSLTDLYRELGGLWQPGTGNTPRGARANSEIQAADLKVQYQGKSFTLDGLYLGPDGSYLLPLKPALKSAILVAAKFLDEFAYQSSPNEEAYKELKALFRKVEAGVDLSKDDVRLAYKHLLSLSDLIRKELDTARSAVGAVQSLLRSEPPDAARAFARYIAFKDTILPELRSESNLRTRAEQIFRRTDPAFKGLSDAAAGFEAAQKNARSARRPLDEKKLLDLLVDEYEDKYIELLEGTRAHTANIDNYLKSVSTALEDDFNTQFYLPAFRRLREAATRGWDVHLGQIETTTVLTNNRTLGKVSPAATMEFDLPKRQIFLTEGFRSAKALFDEYGALLNDPTFLALAKAYSGLPVSSQVGTGGGLSPVRSVLPGLPTSADELLMGQAGPNRKEFGAALEALIPDPAIYKFETGTGYEIRPVLSPDGQSVVFNFDYMYTTDVREPVRADEKHLGRVKRHFVHTDVQLGNYELREVSKYLVALKASRTGKGVALLQDIPAVGVLFRPLPSQGSSLQQNLIYSQAVLFPTLFDLMGLRYAAAVADLDPLAGKNDEWVVRSRRKDLEQRIFDVGATRVDDALRIPFWERRPDLYRSQETLGWEHPNGYYGPGLRQRDSHLQEGYDPRMAHPQSKFAPGSLPSGQSGNPDPAGGLFEPNLRLPPGAYPSGLSTVPPTPGSGWQPGPGPIINMPDNSSPPAIIPAQPPSIPLGPPRLKTEARTVPPLPPPPAGYQLPVPSGVSTRPVYQPGR